MTIGLGFLTKEQLTSYLDKSQKEVQKALDSLEKAYKKNWRIKEAEENYRAARRARDSVLCELSIIAVFEIMKGEDIKNAKN